MSNKNNKQILVVGGAGYIGSHVCKALGKSGYTPICLDNLSNGHREAVQWGPLHQVDLLEPERLKKILSSLKFAAVIHLAAKIEVGESVKFPELYMRNNVEGSKNLFQALAETVGKVPIVFSSTAAVYGDAKADLIAEDTALKPVNPYGESKRLVEEELRQHWRNEQWPSLILRYFNVAGADPDAKIGEWHEPETHLIPRLLSAVEDPNFEMKIFGNDYPTADGTCDRDYVHVEDLAQAHLRALEFLFAKKSVHDAYNIGYSKGYSVLNIIAAVEKVCGKPVRHKIVDRREGDPPRLIADAARAMKDLNWTPIYKDTIEQTIFHAWQWHKKLQSLSS